MDSKNNNKNIEKEEEDKVAKKGVVVDYSDIDTGVDLENLEIVSDMELRELYSEFVRQQSDISSVVNSSESSSESEVFKPLTEEMVNDFVADFLYECERYERECERAEREREDKEGLED